MVAQRWRATLEYHGGAFVGWQVQSVGRAIQPVVEAALGQLADHRVEVTGSGRTDAGVHALGQVISFDLDVDRTPSAVRDGMNRWLPMDVACVEASMAPDGFDARGWVTRKRYRYTWLDRRSRSPWCQDRAMHHAKRLDVERMASAACALVGRHDFTAFRATGCGAAHAVRLVEEATVSRVGDEVRLEVVGNGFLRHMVRIIAGTLTEVGADRLPTSALADAMAAGTRSAAGPTAPPHGLTLVSVEYGAGPRVGS